MSDLSPNNEKSIKEAEAAGFFVVRTAPNLLLLDIDTKEAYQHYLKMFPIVNKQIKIVKIGQWSSKSGKGRRHIVLQTAKALPVVQRMLLQAILGSDLKRELWDLQRVWDQEDNPVVLFKPKQEGTFSKPKKADD